LNIRRDLFSELNLAFFNTTSLYFEGEGGQEIGAYGHARITTRTSSRWWWAWCSMPRVGRSVASSGPGNTADSKTLLPVVARLQQRFGVRRMREFRNLEAG
jgi:hypothetical protein